MVLFWDNTGFSAGDGDHSLTFSKVPDCATCSPYIRLLLHSICSIVLASINVLHICLSGRTAGPLQLNGKMVDPQVKFN